MKYILTGCVVTMDAARTVLRSGSVYVDGNLITAVADSAKPPPAGFEAAKKITTKGIIFPGLIELHNHLSYNILQLWSVPSADSSGHTVAPFKDRGQWQRHPQYVQLVNGPMLKLSQ